MTALTVGSTFTGVGGADLGFEQAGFTISWQCELDAWKRSVLAAHWPDVQIFDDITTMLDPPPVDILIGGFPCQDLSVAGQRKGFTGERSVLAFEFLRLAESIRPRWLILENVPGLLSSSQGADFARLIDEVVACGYGVAWRILDARYFGVPQRRRRVFIVARRTDALIDSPEASRLALRALRESGSGDIASGWQAWQETARGAGQSSQGGRVVGVNGDVTESISNAVTRKWAKGTGGPAGDECQNLITDALAFRKSRMAQTMTDDNTWVEGDHANTLNSFDAGDVRTTHAVLASFYSTGGSQQGFARTDGVSPTLKIGSSLDIASPVAIVSDSYYVEDCENAALRANGANDGPPRTDKHPLVVETFPIDDGRDLEKHQNGTDIAGAYVTQAYSIREDDASNTFSATPIDAARCLQKHQPSVQSHHAQTFIAETFPIDDGRDLEKHQNGTGIGAAGDPAYTIDRQQRPAVAHLIPFDTNFSNQQAPGGNTAATLDTRGAQGVADQMSVRRLTPTECERLMGWPDEWTAPEGVKAPDSKRYAACGDGIVAPVAFWIADRIRMIEAEA